MKRGHIPIRTCRACGRKASRAELDRLVMREDRLTVDESRDQTGRGIYCCRNTACRERLIARTGKRKKRIAFSVQKRKEDGSNQ
ncbi:MAG TPA: DUF448 domain-containing protein [Desulfobacteraceae bacterium]|nr:DUF448 domain-containing protein [Desulfobacteraceae bacterium]